MADRSRILGVQRAAERSGAARLMAMKSADRFAGSASTFWCDTNGLIAPYVAVMLPVLVGFALLAIDASRRMSLQTQMQAAADSLALAGARELNKGPGAESRAISAMANVHASTKSANTVVGVGSARR
jgi:Flp pilus assembly protein TadG